MESSLVPALAPVGDAPVVQGLAYLHEAVATERALEQLLHHRSGGRVNLQRGTLLHPVADLDSLVSEGGLGAEEEAARGGLTHTPDNLLRQIFAVELVHALDDGLHEFAGGGVVGVLGDGHYPDALAP